MSPSSSIFGGRGRLTTFGGRYLRNFTIRCVYEQLKAIGSRAWSPKVLTIFAPCTEFLLALLCFLFLFLFLFFCSRLCNCAIFSTQLRPPHTSRQKIFTCRLLCGEFRQVCDKIGACRAISDSARSQNVLSGLVGWCAVDHDNLSGLARVSTN